MMINDNLESRMRIIDDSFESDYDKSTYEQGTKLLCDYCQKEYLLPSYKSCKYFIL